MMGVDEKIEVFYIAGREPITVEADNIFTDGSNHLHLHKSGETVAVFNTWLFYRRVRQGIQ